jgi:hypothetical protein
MKTLKSFSFFIVIALLLSSCVVKSLHAFYTQNLLFFEQKFIGNWLDKDNGNWSVLPFQEVFKDVEGDLDKDELKMYSKYNNIAYYINYEKDSTKSAFLAVPFKINNQLFLDFTTVDDGESLKGIHSLYKMHLIETHSLAKLDIDSKENVSIKWLDSEKLAALLKANKIKIKYEKVGLDEDIVLTASSEELVKFIEKYMASNDGDKWKTRTEAILKRI